MIKKIAVFNHKGGVSKTTTSFNLGWAIAKTGKRVILVDADSQCNLTLFALGYENYQKFYETNNQNNIHDALSPAFKSKARLIESVICSDIPRNKNLLLMPGHLDFSENDLQLGISFQLSNALGAMKNLPGAFNYLIHKTAEKYNAEFVIVDMNPSLSAINQDILLSCSYFMVPTSPDFFSVMSIRSLARVIPTWERWAKGARHLLSDAEYKLPEQTPKFLGYTINDFNLSQGQAQGSFRQLMDRISDEVVKTLIPALQNEGMLLSDNKYKLEFELMTEKNDNLKYKNQFCLAEISNFNKLIALSNEQSIPVFELNLESAQSGQIRTLNWFKFLFSALANRIIGLTNE